MIDYSQYLTRGFAKRYLATYFRGIDADERAITEFLVDEYAKLAGASSMLDIGCGPGVQHVLPAVPYVDRIDMADFLPDNLDELRKWRLRDANAHDWRHFTKLILELEQVVATPAAIEEREERLREKLRLIERADVLRELPLGEPRQYPAVGFFYCAEAAVRTKDEWARIMARIARMVEPGGHLMMASLRGAHYYTVDQSDGHSEVIPCACVDENDFHALLPQLDFDPQQTKVEIVDTSSMADHGIDTILLVSATKKGTAPGSQRP